MPFCGYTYSDVEYEFSTDGVKWLQYDRVRHALILTVLKAEDMPAKSFNSCFKSSLAPKNIEKIECFRVIPHGFDERQIFEDILEENGIRIEDDPSNDEDDDGIDESDGKEAELSLDEMFVNEQALREEWMSELRKEYWNGKVK